MDALEERLAIISGCERNSRVRITIEVDVPDWKTFDETFKHAWEVADIVKHKTWQDVSGTLKRVAVTSVQHKDADG